MHGLMMERALTISSLIEHAAKFHKNTEIVSRTVEGPIHRYTYGEAYRRVNQLANVLTNLGVSEGDRVGTLAWNGYRHFELYFAVSGMGSICHTINPRLFPEQITYIINHANDKVIFCDLTFVPVLESLAEQLVNVHAIVIMPHPASQTHVIKHVIIIRLYRIMAYQIPRSGKHCRRSRNIASLNQHVTNARGRLNPAAFRGIKL